MNMFLHGIVPENQMLRNGDTLDGDWPTGEETDFNMVLMNPPYERKCHPEIIIKNVLNNVEQHTISAFLLPDKKLEKDNSDSICFFGITNI